MKKKSQGYYFKPAFVDIAPRTQTAYPADKWTIKNNELYYEYIKPDGTLTWRTPLIQGFNRRPLPIAPEALLRMKEFWSIPSADLKRLAIKEFNENNLTTYYGTPMPNVIFNNLRDLVNLVFFFRKEPRVFEGLGGSQGIMLTPEGIPGNPLPYCTEVGTDFWFEDPDGNKRQVKCSIGIKGKVYPYMPVNWSKYASGAWVLTGSGGGVPTGSGGGGAPTGWGEVPVPKGFGEFTPGGSGGVVTPGGQTTYSNAAYPGEVNQIPVGVGRARMKKMFLRNR